MTTIYRRITIPASELRPAAPSASTDPLYFDVDPAQSEHTADLIETTVDGFRKWARVYARPVPFPADRCPDQVRIDLETRTCEVLPIFRAAWEPVEVLRPESSPPAWEDAVPIWGKGNAVVPDISEQP